uniref:Uncharacterized protein n=1 Tax=Arundo donax TaxID=35708 RepID=A0A0A9I2L0_ARUDO
MCTQWRDPVLPELAVCDPLTRRYTLLPQMPDCLVASTLGQVRDQHIESFDAFFVPWVDYNEVQFRVIGWAYCEAMAAVFVYAFALRQLDCWYFYQLGCSRLERATRRLPTIELVAQLCVWLLLLESDLEQHVAQARH